MTMTMTMPDRSSRWLLVGSLALNLFFIGTLGSLAVRHYRDAVAARRDRTPAHRGRAHRAACRAAAGGRCREAARRVPRARNRGRRRARCAQPRASSACRRALRAQPFDPAQLRAALAEVRAARPVYEQAMQEIYLAAAAAMSPEGRGKLADWPAPRPARTRADIVRVVNARMRTGLGTERRAEACAGACACAVSVGLHPDHRHAADRFRGRCAAELSGGAQASRMRRCRRPTGGAASARAN